MLVSVIVPIYNIPINILRACVESLIGQSLQKIEIILIDDGNINNECSEICDEYASLDDRIVVIHQENQGVSVARNKGIEIAKSPYIAFVDADDWVNEKMLEVTYNVATKTNADIVLFDHEIEKEESIGRKVVHLERDYPEFFLYKAKHEVESFQRSMISNLVDLKINVHGAPWGKLYKKNILLDNNLRFKPNLIRSQDNEFNFRVFEYVKSVAYINKKLYHYRIFSGSAMNKFRENSREIQEIYLKELKGVISYYKKTEVFYNDYHVAVINKLADICRTQYVHPSNPQPFTSRVKGIKELLNQEPFVTAINNLNSNELKRINKFLLILAKKRSYLLIYFLFSIRYKFKSLFK